MIEKLEEVLFLIFFELFCGGWSRIVEVIKWLMFDGCWWVNKESEGNWVEEEEESSVSGWEGININNLLIIFFVCVCNWLLFDCLGFILKLLLIIIIDLGKELIFVNILFLIVFNRVLVVLIELSSFGGR